MSDADERLVLDKAAKGKQVAALVQELAQSNPMLISMREALESGAACSAALLSGGLTNYSFRVSVAGAPPVFAKLSFPYALWNPNPDEHYDLERTENEAIMMSRFASLAPGCVASVYACLDIAAKGDHPAMKLLVTEWCTADEQFANQVRRHCHVVP